MLIVANQFTRVAQNERCSFFGNVSLGSSVTLAELREMYNAVSSIHYFVIVVDDQIGPFVLVNGYELLKKIKRVHACFLHQIVVKGRALSLLKYTDFRIFKAGAIMFISTPLKSANVENLLKLVLLLSSLTTSGDTRLTRT
ncbi:nadph:adrenodoxin oxidoreductase mitochondrial [Phtheirospermum japonicum]|uniref:Nadph:adrenodoxin oxidoreductase mitochondrial n=1 Tax=Phtheirospermum japonicum TaxID=374723 RepID=A0A830BXY8_9LAMI|nr:nadph:adrenodoxin oxidoreductase mitochondrial [Phtheirospermum japonicum]